MADEADDLEYSDSNVGLAQAQGVRKNISLKLKGKGRGRGRRGGKVRRGAAKKIQEEEAEDSTEQVDVQKQPVDTNLEDVISKLEAPAFSPMDRTFPEPLHQNKKLRWDHKVNLIGEKVIDPLIHCCEKCSLPILSYGRMLPCKHVFCFDCAKKAEKVCIKCDEKIARIESSALGTVFMCTFGGTRHSPGACGRTYLSQRDLQAHINHRHLKPSSSSPAQHQVAPPPGQAVRDPRAHALQVDVSHHLDEHARGGATVPPMGSPAGQSRQQYPANYSGTIPVSSTRPNLITVPIQEEPAHLHPLPPYASPGTAPLPPQMQYSYQQQPPYSQAPPITTPAFSQPPPPVHHQQQMHQPGGGAIYSTPPPPYTAPPRNPIHAMPPQQRFHEEGAGSYMPPQWGGGVPPPPARATLPPRPLPAPSASNPITGQLQPRGGPPDPAYRQPYYQ